MSDLISRQAAIDALGDKPLAWTESEYELGLQNQWQSDVDALKALPSAQPDVPEINVGDINKFIDSLEEIFADLRERHGDDSVCGLCEYDGAYIGQSGDWCNECPGFDRDDCFKLSDKCRKRWIDTITKALPSAQQWIPVSERLPEEDLWTGRGKQFSNSVLMTVYDKNDEDTIVDYGHTMDGEWYSETGDEYIESIADWKVIAWMPLPEPYKGEQE